MQVIKIPFILCWLHFIQVKHSSLGGSGQICNYESLYYLYYLNHTITQSTFFMKKILKFAGILLLITIVGLTGVAMYLKNTNPNVGPAENITVDTTAATVEHGRYLANNVAACMDCHSQRDFSVYAAPLLKETFAQGGQKFGKEEGFPGTLYSKNITPYNLGSWTDGEIFRAITCGVSKDGSALFPVMPYPNFGKLDKRDIMSIIAYLRTLPAIKSDYPGKELNFPINILLNTMPAKAQLSVKPDTANRVAYGKYLITMASCVNCHSKENKGNIIPGSEYGGGREFTQPNGLVRTANITPDVKTGIGSWTKETFIRRFKMYADSNNTPVRLNPTDVNTPMPWYMYANMKEDDLAAIYDYLHTVKPIENSVTKFQKNK
jgi:mono/diheme cytochrome c family protein